MLFDFQGSQEFNLYSVGPVTTIKQSCLITTQSPKQGNNGLKWVGQSKVTRKQMNP
jgi:hypothetical protein